MSIQKGMVPSSPAARVWRCNSWQYGSALEVEDPRPRRRTWLMAINFGTADREWLRTVSCRFPLDSLEKISSGTLPGSVIIVSLSTATSSHKQFSVVWTGRNA